MATPFLGAAQYRELCLALLLLFLAPTLTAHADETAGQVQVVVGAAQLIDFNGASRPLERGATVKQGDRIVTGEGALVQMKMADGALVSVRTNTDVAVEKYRYNTQSAQESSMLLRLARGALRSITGLIGGSNPDAYKVITPTATIGIRGTDHEPVFIPEPKPGEVPIGQPGTYDKVNSGATIIQTQVGVIDVKPGQVGFVPIAPGIAPRVLPATPDFFQKLDAKPDSAGRTKPLGDGKMLARPLLKPSLDSGLKSGSILEPTRTETTLDRTLTKTVSPTTIESSSTLLTAPKLDAVTTTTLQPTTTTLIAPTTTIQPTTTLIAPTTTLIAPTMTIQPTTTLIAPTTTIQPTTTLIAPTTTIKPTTLIAPTTTTILK